MTNQEMPRSSERVGAGTALGRLDSIRARQMSLKEEMARNWQGWVGSLTLHAALLMLFAAMGSAIVQATQAPEAWRQIDVFAAKQNEDMKTESMEELFDDSRVLTEKDGKDSFDTGQEALYAGFTTGQPGQPDWFGFGNEIHGPWGDGGGGGLDFGGKGWGGYIRGIQRTGLEVVFCVDATGSMGGILLEVKTRIRELAKVITYLVPNARIGVVAYRDWKKYDMDDYEWLVKYMPLQKCNKEGMDKTNRFVRELEAYGGGDIPEAVQVGIQTAIEKCGWTPNTKKIIIVFGDAPPHAEDNGLAFTYGLCKKWKDAGGVISCIDTTGSSKIMDEFRQMAAEGGGEASFLNDERALIKELVVLVFGSKWEKEIDGVYDTVLRAHEDTVVTP